MLYTIVALVLMGSAALWTALSFPFLMAIELWLASCAVAGALAAFALMRQPIGQSTALGHVGGLFLRWGFLAGQGKLIPAVVISWMVWALVGVALILGTQNRADHELQFMILAWTVDLLALMHMVGLALARRSATMWRGLLPVMAVLAGMLLVSALQWTHPSLVGDRHTALLIAGGPPLFLGTGYALFLLAMLTFGRKARWN